MLESKVSRVWLSAAFFVLANYWGGILSAQDRENQKAVVNYRVGVGDELAVEVYGHLELSCKTVVVDRHGKISLPSVKVVKVSGLSLIELVNLLHRKLEPEVPRPQIYVSVLYSPSLHLSPPSRPSPLLRDTPSPEQRQGSEAARQSP